MEHSQELAQHPDGKNPTEMNPQVSAGYSQDHTNSGIQVLNNAQNISMNRSTINNVKGDQHNYYQFTDAKAKEIWTWINPPDCSANFVAACDKMTEGTGMWLIEDSRFKKWLTNDHGKLFWLQGKG
ncbi:hypothetical protein K435DRAFT_193811 [Dendrothele bispora CBS 962.96]|uniref:Uncharacterized protein n=1 Tax=Dendrothele bispora (strain CBS 962.96) TaxID=1314807 RepID=A0A4S8LVH7_DENBC|nr:hypothetical protein K435DRAFT_193811 [Dendrothele bispora CBS 962.96]